ncbi:MAG: PaaI family thioesterase [Acidobacteria bacterium]|nr:MAG: PaaI family thioesterase [Acidobacteriota bacterium]REK04346.1 MAG: PaaI family thioesterase [Acidobacteriota bacterium]
MKRAGTGASDPAGAAAAVTGAELALPTSHGCFVCGESNRHGLRLRFRAVGPDEEGRQGRRVVADTSLCTHHAGFAQRAHGGIVAALLDEAMGWATILRGGRFSFTGELQVRYLRPAPIGVPLRVEAWVERHNRRMGFAAARLSARGQEPGTVGGGDGEAGEVLATATGKFLFTGRAESERIAEQLIYSEGSWRLPSDP